MPRDPFSRKQKYEIITALEGRGEVPMKFEYMGDYGARNWEDVQKTNTGEKIKGLLYYQDQLLDTKAGSLLESFGKVQRLNVIDLGCGDGRPMLPIIRHLARKYTAKKIKYVPIDISKEMLAIAAKEAKSQFNVESMPYVIDFEAGNFSDVTFDIRKQGATNLMILLGNTLGNSPDMHRLLSNFRESMTRNDYLLIGVELVNENLARYVVRQYETKEIYRFVFGVLANYGVKMSDGRIKVRFNKRLSRVELFFIPHRDIDFKIGYESIHIDKGSVINLWYSTKFTGPLLTSLLADAGFRVDLYTTTHENNFALVLCQPSRTRSMEVY